MGSEIIIVVSTLVTFVRMDHLMLTTLFWLLDMDMMMRQILIITLSRTVGELNGETKDTLKFKEM